jgi:hypothetical protein
VLVQIIGVLAGVPACVAYAVRGNTRLRTIVGTIHLALAFLTALAAATQASADPPKPAAIPTGLLAVVFAVTAIAIRPAHDPARTSEAAPQGGFQDPTALAPPPQHARGWSPQTAGAQPPPGPQPAPGQGMAPGPAPQQPWPPSGP